MSPQKHSLGGSSWSAREGKRIKEAFIEEDKVVEERNFSQTERAHSYSPTANTNVIKHKRGEVSLGFLRNNYHFGSVK